MTSTSIGTRLIALKERSGLSLPKIARSGGYKNASSVQRYFSEDYNPDSLPGPVAMRLIEALVGFGDPPIQREDIISLTDIGFMLERKFSPDAGTLPMIRRARPTEIYCVPTFRIPAEQVRGAPSVEAMSLAQNDPVRAFVKPAHLSHRPIDAMFVSARTMSPRYAVGEMIFFEHERPAAAGQDVVIYLDDEGPNPTVLLCRLIDEGDLHYEVATLTPAAQHMIPKAIVEIIAPVLPFSEVFEPARLTR